MRDDDWEDDPIIGHQTRTSDLALRQANEARDFIAKIRAGGFLRMPWPDVDELVGPILEGFLVAVGGRAKAGKSTLLRDLLTAWTEIGKTVVYVGTETQASILRLAWAAVRHNIRVETALDPSCPKETMEKLLADVEWQTTGPLSRQAIFGDCESATVAALDKWVRYAQDAEADVLIFDHFHQMEHGTAGKRWENEGDAVKAIKKMANRARLPIVMGAQLTQGEGGSWLGEHEIPGNRSWAGTADIQRTVDIGIQVWRPFKPRITAEQKREAREDYTKVKDLVQENTMGIRMSAHRWKGSVMGQCTKLYVESDQLHSWSFRPTHPGAGQP